MNLSAPGAVAGVNVQKLFDAIAPEYDRFNAWASLGLHQHWRRTLVSRIPQGAEVLDIATGTGDLAFLEARRGHRVTGLDFSEPMLARAQSKDTHHAIRWILGSAFKTEFPDSSFDCITSAFALRNLKSNLRGLFAENFRLLRKNGKVLHMDFGRPPAGPLRWGHRLHLEIIVPTIGKWLCGNRWPDKYLETTIENFEAPSTVEQLLKEAGFSRVGHSPLLWGVVQLFEAIK